MPHDFTLEHHGTVALLRPRTHAADKWLRENVVAERWQWFGRVAIYTLAVEPRLIPNITQALRTDGLTVQCV